MERLWERSREEQKETNSGAKYKNLEGRHEKSGQRERGNRGSESGDGHRESSCEAEPGKTARETRLERTGKAKEAKAEGSTEEATVRRRREERGKEETEAK